MELGLSRGRFGSNPDHAPLVGEEPDHVMLVSDLSSGAERSCGRIRDESDSTVDIPHMEPYPEQLGAINSPVRLTLVHQAVAHSVLRLQPAETVGGFCGQHGAELRIVTAIGHRCKVLEVLGFGVGRHLCEIVALVRFDEIAQIRKAVVRDPRRAGHVEAVAAGVIAISPFWNESP